MLFRQLPDALFAPLAGPNRTVYGEVLLALQPLFFEQVEEQLFPSRETVRGEIEEALARIGAFSWQHEEEEGESAALPLNPAGCAYRVYRRLLACGWLEEEAEGYRVFVTVPPAVGELLGGLASIARERRVFYGGVVLSIYNNVRLACEEPEGQALAFREACKAALQFQRHLTGLVYGLKGLLERLEGITDRGRLLASFFDDFVERILVADYKRLKTRNNPFRFRQQILALVRELRLDPERKGRLLAGYQEQMELTDREAALRELDRDLHLIAGVFEQVDRHLERIDRYRYRFERRVADSVRYLDRTLPGGAARLTRLLEGLGRVLPAEAGALTALPPLPLARPLPIADGGLRPPRGAVQPPAPAALASRAVEEEQLARQRALRDYLDRRRADPARILAYLERQMAGRERVEGNQLTIASVEEYIAFTQLRRLHRLGAAVEPVTRRYRVEPRDEWLENDYLRARDFTVVRVGRRGPQMDTDGHG